MYQVRHGHANSVGMSVLSVTCGGYLVDEDVQKRDDAEFDHGPVGRGMVKDSVKLKSMSSRGGMEELEG